MAGRGGEARRSGAERVVERAISRYTAYTQATSYGVVLWISEGISSTQATSYGIVLWIIEGISRYTGHKLWRRLVLTCLGFVKLSQNLWDKPSTPRPNMPESRYAQIRPDITGPIACKYQTGLTLALTLTSQPKPCT
jgi:hypothetical protein